MNNIELWGYMSLKPSMSIIRSLLITWGIIRKWCLLATTKRSILMSSKWVNLFFERALRINKTRNIRENLSLTGWVLMSWQQLLDLGPISFLLLKGKNLLNLSIFYIWRNSMLKALTTQLFVHILWLWKNPKKPHVMLKKS